MENAEQKVAELDNGVMRGALRGALRGLLIRLSVRTDREFTLASGRKSNFFVDCKQAVLTSEGHKLVGILMTDRVLKAFPEASAVAGVQLGGCPLASAVSMESGRRWLSSGMNALYVRKEKKDHGTTQMVEGKGSVPAGSKVVLLEDVFTSGSSAIKSVEVLRAEGYDVVGVIGLVDREEGAAEAFSAAGIRFESLFKRSELL